MFIILRNAKDITETYKKVANLDRDLEDQTNSTLAGLARETKLHARITTLELENETLQREVEHWKAEAVAARDKHGVNTGSKAGSGNSAT